MVFFTSKNKKELEGFQRRDLKFDVTGKVESDSDGGPGVPKGCPKAPFLLKKAPP